MLTLGNQTRCRINSSGTLATVEHLPTLCMVLSSVSIYHIPSNKQTKQQEYLLLSFFHRALGRPFRIQNKRIYGLAVPVSTVEIMRLWSHWSRGKLSCRERQVITNLDSEVLDWPQISQLLGTMAALFWRPHFVMYPIPTRCVEIDSDQLRGLLEMHSVV